MAERPGWVPDEVDLERPSAARVYDYYLGGSHNFAVDRQLAEQAMRLLPQLPQMMRANRAFMRRAVRAMAAGGVSQFLDLGSGIPTAGNVHEVAQRVVPDARVVYVDADPVAVAQSRLILSGDERTAVVQADLRQPEQVLGAAEVRGLLDLDRPVGVLMVAVLHFVADDADPGGIVARFRDAVAAGSYVAISHGTQEGGDPEQAARMQALYARSDSPLTPRTRAEVEGLLAGLELLDPGVVYLPQWRPDGQDEFSEAPQRSSTFAGVGRRP